jgi:hypothetical protein
MMRTVADEVICGICGKRFEKIGWQWFFAAHVRRFHQWNITDYINQFYHKEFKFDTCGWCGKRAEPNRKIENGVPILYYDGSYVCNNEDCKKERHRHNTRSYVYAMKTYKITLDEAKDFVRKGSPFHREFFGSAKEHRKFQNQTSRESFIRKYGNEEGEKRYERYVDRWRKKCGSENAFIERFGEKEGKERWKENCKNKAVTRKTMRNKYGDEEGDRRYEKFLSKTLKNFVSKSSCWFLTLVDILSGYHIHHGRNHIRAGEKKIRCKESIIPVDGYCEELNVVIEFFGDVWHCHPKFYKGFDTNPRGSIADDIWKYDHQRLCKLSDVCRAVIVCWEYDWTNKPTEILTKCLGFLKKIQDETLPRGVYYL